MTHQQRVARVKALVQQFRDDPAAFEALSHGEPIIVAVAASRLDLLKRCGVAVLDQAKDRLGHEWWRAITAVQQR